MRYSVNVIVSIYIGVHQKAQLYFQNDDDDDDDE